MEKTVIRARTSPEKIQHLNRRKRVNRRDSPHLDYSRFTTLLIYLLPGALPDWPKLILLISVALEFTQHFSQFLIYIVFYTPVLAWRIPWTELSPQGRNLVKQCTEIMKKQYILNSVHGILQARTGVGSHFLLQGNFPDLWGLNLGLLYCRQILYHVSRQGSKSITGLLLEVVLREVFKLKVQENTCSGRWMCEHLQEKPDR